ncbi:hypothetical protein Esi_0102_0023 [Ectocarpus siliculosus]|uniref:Uncharacterized protein n=1 Tax=Ectocarpus siliculosus TaxID=2880 RepID=D7FGV0_ECTSI|nr:hypothetical protein Esi_0102_0023 [Ectocarpus siliculosus]|eukprot:CBJ48939.1 hypothetical protein Esi_0102_0023 [Ectocarpus siliculosus]
MEAVDGLRHRASPPVALHHRLLTSPVTPFPTRVVRGADTELEENRLAVLQMPKTCFREKLNLLPGKFHLRVDLAMVRQTPRSRHICPATTSHREKTRGRGGRRTHHWLGRQRQGQGRRRRRLVWRARCTAVSGSGEVQARRHEVPAEFPLEPDVAICLREADVRQIGRERSESADEMREALALRDESRRLRTARAERARRARIAQQKIARYREDRIRELESRLARHSGDRQPDAPPTPRAEAPAAPGDAQVTEQGLSVDINANKLQQLSRQRREIEAAIAAALEEDPTLEDKSPRSDRSRGDGAESLAVEHERPKSGRRKRAQLREEEPYRRQQQQPPPPRRRRSGDSSSRTQEDPYVFGQDVDYQEQDEPPAIPLGKPPLAPCRAGGERRRKHSNVRRQSSVSEVDERLDRSEGGGIPESFPRDGENDRDSDVDEVQTEDGNGNDSGWSNNRLSDFGGSVWEENVSSRGWDADDGRGEVPPLALVETEELRARGDENQPRRQRHWVRSGGHEHVESSMANQRRGEERDIGSHRGGSLEQRSVPRTDHGEVVGHPGASEPLDDDGSYNSRWSLSDEDEAQERSGGERGASTRQAYAGDASGSDDRAREPSRSSHREAQKHTWDEDASVASNTKEGGGNVAGMVPEYLDDFFEEKSEGHDRGDDVPFAVSEPSDEENPAFAAGEELPSDRKSVSAQSWVVDQEESHPAGVDEDPDQVLLQPVSPPVLRHSAQAAAVVAAKAEGGSLERSVEVQVSPVGEPPTNLHGGASKEEVSPSHGPENPVVTTVGNARDDGRTIAEEDDSESGDVATPMKIDSAVLFASLSSSTAGTSLSSKSMARAEGKWGSRTGTSAAALAAKQGEVSASTFALSTTDDDGDTGVNSEGKGDISRGRSSARLSDRQQTPDNKCPPVADTGEALVGSGRVATDANKPEEGSEPRASAPPPATSTRSESGGVVTLSPEADRRSESPPALGERQSRPPSDDSLGGLPHNYNSSSSTPAPSPLLFTTPSELEATRPVVGDHPVPLLAKEEGQPSSEGSHHATLEPEQEKAILSTLEPSASPRGEQASADSSDISSGVGGDPTVQAAVLDNSPSAPSQRTEMEGVAGDLDNEPSINGPESDKTSYLDGRASPDEHEGGLAGREHERDGSARDQEGAVLGTLEGQSLLAENSSHSGSALDVGGGAVDGDDDDDGYF